MSSPSYAGWTINDFLAAPLDHEDGSPNIRNRMVKIITDCQDAICAGVEKVDGKAKFHEDSWDRPNGGGGRTRVISGKLFSFLRFFTFLASLMKKKKFSLPVFYSFCLPSPFFLHTSSL